MNGILTSTRSYLATAKMASYVPAREIYMLVAVILLRLSVFTVLAGVWSTFDRNSLAAAGVSLTYLITYSALAQSLASILNPATGLNEYIASGWISVRLTWPTGMARLFAAEWLGRVFWITAICSVVIAIVGFPLGVYLPTLSQLSLFILSLALAISVGIAVDYLFAFLTLDLNNGIWFVNSIRQAFTVIVSGALVPLTLMPWNLGYLLQFLPFASMASAPLQIFMSSPNTHFLIIVQLAWTCVLWAALYFWNQRLGSRLVAAGG